MLTFDRELASKILTGLTGKTYEPYAEPPAEGDEDFQEMIDAVHELSDRHGPDMVVALAVFAEEQSAHLGAHGLDDYTREHFQGSGHSVGEVLEDYASSQEREVSDLGRLYDELDRAGAVDYFPWGEYANSQNTPVQGLRFVVVPATGGVDTVYLFTEG